MKKIKIPDANIIGSTIFLLLFVPFVFIFSEKFSAHGNTIRKGNTMCLKHNELIKINNLGYRGPEIEINKGSYKRIIAVGDSSTFGYFLDYEESYPAILEQLLNKRIGTKAQKHLSASQMRQAGKGTENSAECGVRSAECNSEIQNPQLAVVEDASASAVGSEQLAIQGTQGTHHSPLTTHHSSSAISHQPSATTNNQKLTTNNYLQHSTTHHAPRTVGWQVINAGIPKANTRDIYYIIKRTFILNPDIYIVYIGVNDFGAGLAQFSKNLQKVILLLKGKKKKIILLTYPYRSVKKTEGTYNQEIRRLAKKFDIALIDLERIISKDKLSFNYFLPDNVHPTVEGNKKIAKIIFHGMADLKITD